MCGSFVPWCCIFADRQRELEKYLVGQTPGPGYKGPLIGQSED
jgi:hypothetical protein